MKRTRLDEYDPDDFDDDIEEDWDENAGIAGNNRFPTAPIPAMSAPMLRVIEGKLMKRMA